MAVTNFLREVWSKKINDALEMKALLVAQTNREYEGDAKYAKTVRILGVGDPMVDAYMGKVEYEDMDDTKQNLDIDIREYFAFKVDDVDKAQSMPGLPEKYQEKAVTRLHNRREIAVGRLVAGKLLNTADEKNTSVTTYATTSDSDIIMNKDYYIQVSLSNGGTSYKRVKTPKKADLSSYYEITTSTRFKEGAEHKVTATGKTQSAIKLAIDTALANLRLRNADEAGYLNLDVVSYGTFKNNIVELSTNNPEMIRKGIVGMYDNYTVTRTNALHYDGTNVSCFAHTGNAIAFAGQIDEVEALRLESTFGDGIRGLDVYGMKIINQAEIELIEIPV